MIGIVQRDGNIGKAHRFSGLCSGKDDILHGGAAQLPDALFPQHPAHRVRDIALAAPVRSYNGSDPVMKLKIDLIGE